jgi:hypothetical protein
VFAILRGAGNGILTLVRSTLPLAISGLGGFGHRLGLLGVLSRISQAVAPLAFDLAGGYVLLVTSALSLSALVALTLPSERVDRCASNPQFGPWEPHLGSACAAIRGSTSPADRQISSLKLLHAREALHVGVYLFHAEPKHDYCTSKAKRMIRVCGGSVRPLGDLYCFPHRADVANMQSALKDRRASDSRTVAFLVGLFLALILRLGAGEWGSGTTAR